MERNKRIFGYDALKALAAFFVVLYHVGMVDFGYREGVYYYPTLVQLLWLFCACGVPLFFMVNGALTVKRGYDLKKSLVKAGRLVLIGAFWGVVMMGINAICKQDNSFFSLNRVAYYWFLFSLAAMYVINFMLSCLPRWCRWVVVGLLLVIPFMTNAVWDVVQLLHPDVELPFWGHFGALTMYGLVYLYAGDHLSTHRYALWVPWLCALTGLALLAVEATAVVNHNHQPFEGGNYCFPTLGALLLSIALFEWLKNWNFNWPSWLKLAITFLGNNALGVYIFHLMLMVVMGTLFPQIKGVVLHPVLAVLVTLAYMFASAVISELLRRSPLALLLRL